MIRAVLSNPSHPEYGVVTIPLPISRAQYDDAVRELEELDYLIKRLDSFDTGEAAQFQGMTEKLDLTSIPEFMYILSGTLSLSREKRAFVLFKHICIILSTD